MDTMKGETLLTVQDAAKHLGVGETAIRNALLRGRIPFQIQYGRKLIRFEDLEFYRLTAKPGRPRKKQEEAT
jgi:excisionase family DNA binding protein